MSLNPPLFLPEDSHGIVVAAYIPMLGK